MAKPLGAKRHHNTVDKYLLTIYKQDKKEPCSKSELLSILFAIQTKANAQTGRLSFELAKTNLHLHTIIALECNTKYKSLLTGTPKGFYIHFKRIYTNHQLQKALNYIQKQSLYNPPDFLETEQYFRYHYGFDDARELERH